MTLVHGIIPPYTFDNNQRSWVFAQSQIGTVTNRNITNRDSHKSRHVAICDLSRFVIKAICSEMAFPMKGSNDTANMWSLYLVNFSQVLLHLSAYQLWLQDLIALKILGKCSNINGNKFVVFRIISHVLLIQIREFGFCTITNRDSHKSGQSQIPTCCNLWFVPICD